MKDTKQKLWQLAGEMITALREMGDAVKKVEEFDKTMEELSKIVGETEKPSLPRTYDALSEKQIMAACEENVLCHKEIEPALAAISELYDLRQAYWEAAGWEPDWDDINQAKCTICFRGGEIFESTSFEIPRFLAFPTQEQRNHFIKWHHKRIKQARPLL